MAGHVEVGRIRGHPSPFLYTLLYRLAKVFSTHAKQYWSQISQAYYTIHLGYAVNYKSITYIA